MIPDKQTTQHWIADELKRLRQLKVLELKLRIQKEIKNLESYNFQGYKEKEDYQYEISQILKEVNYINDRE